MTTTPPSHKGQLGHVLGPVHEELDELKRENAKLRESQKFMLDVLACLLLKFGTPQTIDIEHYWKTGHLPAEPKILTHQNSYGETVVEIQ